MIVLVLQIATKVKSIKQCDSGLAEELSQMRELYRREALQRKLLYNQVCCHLILPVITSYFFYLFCYFLYIVVFTDTFKAPSVLFCADVPLFFFLVANS